MMVSDENAFKIDREDDCGALMLADFIDRIDKNRERLEALQTAIIDKALDDYGSFCRCQRCVSLGSWHGGWLSYSCWIGDPSHHGCLKGNRKILHLLLNFEDNLKNAKMLKESHDATPLEKEEAAHK
jgi:hypothetical protein